MTDFATFSSIASLLLSLGALAVSSRIAIRQTRYARHANNVPVITGIFSEFRSEEFRADLEVSRPF
jgi:hypothetical protein